MFFVTLCTALVILLIDGSPTNDTKASFHDFLSSAAQVQVGLLIALAIEVRSNGLTSKEGEARLEVALAIIWIVLGQALSLVALLPDCPPFTVSIAAAVVPASIVGALAAIVALVVAVD